MLDFNLLTGILVAAAIVLFIKFGLPYIKKLGYKDIYKDVKTALMLFGYAFRDDKIKTLTNSILTVVNEMEKLDISPQEKKAEAIDIAFRTIIEELGVQMDEQAISLIIDIAVSYIPPTNKLEPTHK